MPAMTTPSAAALTEQEQQDVLDAIWSLTSTSETGYPQTKWGIDFKVIESLLAARLADSRPAVGEAAIEAAAEALWDHHDHDMKGAGYNCECGERLQDGWAISPARNAHCEHMARAALTAALPHMGDGRGDAWDEGLQAEKDRVAATKKATPDNPFVAQPRNPYRLSPTGDDSE